jgi:hypothetical protein
MADRLFDPVAYMNESVPKMSTRRLPRPTGQPLAQVTEFDWKSGTVGPGKTRSGQPWYRLDVKLQVSNATDPEYLSQIPGSPEKETFTWGIMYDGDEAGRPVVRQGTNIRLGQLRAMCDANGKPWSACIGAMLRLNIGHKFHPTEVDEDGQPIILDEVTGATRP